MADGLGGVVLDGIVQQRGAGEAQKRQESPPG
jgi:hypothetical protein